MVPRLFPGSVWVGSLQDGKPWRGTTAPMLVIHTLEFRAWPDPQKWTAPAHLVCNPDTGEVRQYLPMDVAAYAVRDNALEDDEPTWQVELWGKAAEVPGYGDGWYRGVSALCDTFVEHYGIPAHFADFSNVAVAYPGASPDRMTAEESDVFSGFLGHCHMGLGTDVHWDPGRLDVERVIGFMAEGGSMWGNDITDRTWMAMFHSGVPGVKGFGRYYCSNDGTYNWELDPLEDLNAPWGSNPHAPTNDGAANYDEKINGLNFLFAGFAEAAGNY